MAAYVANSQTRFLAEEERHFDPQVQAELSAAAPDQVRRIVIEAAIRHQADDVDELMRRARTRLAECAVVGVVERMPESIERLSEVLYGPPLELPPRRNCSTDLRTDRDLDAATRRRLDRLTELDRQLYDEALRGFRRGADRGRDAAAVDTEWPARAA
jgi:hypothetical protein